jgi:hypothetical protein
MSFIKTSFKTSFKALFESVGRMESIGRMEPEQAQRDDERAAQRLVIRQRVRSGFPACVMLSAAYVVYHLGSLVDRERLGKLRVFQFLGIFLSPYMITSLIGEPMQSGVRIVYDYIVQMLSRDYLAPDNPALALARASVQYERHRATLSPEFRTWVEDKLRAANRCVDWAYYTQNVIATCGAVTIALGLPRSKRALVAATVRPEIDRVVGCFAPKLQYGLRLIAASIVAASNAAARPARVRAIMLIGPPGTGKTRAVHEYARALGLPLVKLDIEGPDFAAGSDGQGDWTGLLTPVKRRPPLTAALLTAPCTNAIVFIDEADKPLNADTRKTNFFLRLFDGGDTRVFLPDLGCWHDMADYTFIMAANTPITSKALVNRMVTVQFDGMDIRARDRIARAHFSARVPDAGDAWDDVLRAIIFYETDTGVRSMLGVIDMLVPHIRAHADGWVDRPFDVAQAYERLSIA